MTDLKVFEGMCDWVIAKDLEDLAKVLEEHTGYAPDKYELDDFEEVDLDKRFTLLFVDNGLDYRPPEKDYPEGARVWFEDDPDTHNCWCARASYRQWVDHQGRSFLASTEW